MPSIWIRVAIFSGVLLTTDAASACVLVRPKIESLIESVGSKGVIIRGAVIQRLDAKKRKGMKIVADKVFIGTENKRIYEIYFDQPAIYKNGLPYYNSCSSNPDEDVGASRVFVLKPQSADGSVWQLDPFESMVLSAQNLPRLIQFAAKAGRLRSTLPAVQ